MSDQAVRRPPPLQVGDTVAVVAPSMPVFRDQLDAGVLALRAAGFEVRLGEHIDAVHGHLAGTDQQRVDDLNDALRDPEVRAVWIGRGGYGLTRILDRIDWDALADDPKLLIGFSDVTALHAAAWRRLRLVTVHGQFAGRFHLVAEHDDAHRHLLDLVMGGCQAGPLPTLGSEPRTVVPGRAEGPLVGGNLAVLASMVGTPDQLDASGAILLLEDVNEPPYKLDRALTQLRDSGVLDGVNGIVLGEWVACDPPEGRWSATADETAAERVGDLGVPVLAGLPVGHVDRHLGLPHGARVVLDGDTESLHLAEPALWQQ